MFGSQARNPLKMGSGTTRKHITLAGLFFRVGRLIALWSHRSRSRNALNSADEYILKDIGLTREEAETESLKRFWMP